MDRHPQGGQRHDEGSQRLLRRAVHLRHPLRGRRQGHQPGGADRRSPCWHDVHHLIAPRLLHEAIDAACGDDSAKAEFCRSALLHAGYNITHGRNLLALPLLPDDARRLALPRRLVLDAATVGIPAAIAGAWEGKNLYDEIIRFLLTPIMTALAACFRPEACAEPGPAPGAVAKLALETLSDLIRTIICLPNKALGLLR
jgi:hypothetical protein